MISVEFIYDQDCPNVRRTRENLLRAFVQTGVAAKWTEWERSAPETPDYARHFGSPAILVNGKDVAGLRPNAAATCRIYRNANGSLSGVPPVDLIATTLKHGIGEWHAVRSGTDNHTYCYRPPPTTGAVRKESLDPGLGPRV